MHFLRAGLPLSVILLSLPLLSACDDDAADGTGTGASSSGDASAGSTGTMSSSSSGTGGMGGAPVYTPPAVKAACAAPTIGAPKELGDPMDRYGSPALDWHGGEAVLAYALRDGMDTWGVHLRALGADATIGADVQLSNQAKSGSFTPPTVTVATGPTESIVCHDQTNTGPKIRCFVVKAGAAALGLEVAGAQPSLAFGAAGYGLVYVDGDTMFSQRLKGDGTADGPPHEVASSTSMDGAAPILTATSDGYAALSSAWGLMWRFNAQFGEIEGMAVAGWKDKPTRIAGSGAFVGAVHGDTDGVKFRRVSPENVLGAASKIDAPGASPIYQYTAIARGDAQTFAAVWSGFEGNVGYRAIDATGGAIGAATDVLSTAWDDNAVAITPVADGFIVAATANPSFDTLRVVHLACP